MAFKRRKLNARVTNFFYKLLIWWVIINKLKSDVSDEPRCKLIVNTTLVVCKNVVENVAKCNFIK